MFFRTIVGPALLMARLAATAGLRSSGSLPGTDQRLQKRGVRPPKPKCTRWNWFRILVGCVKDVGRAHHHAGQGRTGVARKKMRHAAQSNQRQLYTPWPRHSSDTKTWQNWRRQQSAPMRSWSTPETRSRNDRRRLQKLRAELRRETARLIPADTSVTNVHTALKDW